MKSRFKTYKTSRLTSHQTVFPKLVFVQRFIYFFKRLPYPLVAADSAGHDQRLGVLVPQVVHVGENEAALKSSTKMFRHRIFDTEKPQKRMMSLMQYLLLTFVIVISELKVTYIYRVLL